MERAASRLRSASSGSMPRSSGRRITPRSRSRCDHFRVARAADLGVAGHAADRLFALVLVAAEQEIGDAFLRDDVGDVVAVDHHRRQIELQLLGKLQRVQLFDEERRRSSRRRSRRSARPACGRGAEAAGPSGSASLPAFSQGALGWRRPRASEPMFGAPPKPAMREVVTVDWNCRRGRSAASSR